MLNSKTKILFIGTADFAINPLAKLLAADDYDIVGVVTQPDRPAGRKKVLTPPPLKKFLLENYQEKFELDELRLFQPEKLKQEAASILDETKPDLIVVVAYGQMIPKVMLDHPKHGCINIHGSLLPKYRGAVPVQMALLNGDTETGVSILQMTPGLDDGPVLAELEEGILPEDDANTLFAKLSELGADLLLRVLPDWIAGRLVATPQDMLSEKYGRELSTCRISDMDRANAQVNVDQNIDVALNRVRAFAANGGAWMNIMYKGSPVELKICKARKSTAEYPGMSWGKLTWKNDSLNVGFPGGMMELVEVQVPGKTPGPGHAHRYLIEDQDKSVRLIVRYGGEMLVIRRNRSGRKYLSVPGGHVKLKESFAEAAVRELPEETGITITQEELTELFRFNSERAEEVVIYEITLSDKPEVRLGQEEELRNVEGNVYELAWIAKDSEELNMIPIPELREFLTGK